MNRSGEGSAAISVASESWTRRDPPDPLQRKHGLIGASVSRLDGPLKVQGGARFAAEFLMDGMLYAAFAYSTISRGRIVALDTAAAEEAPGVALVMTYLNAPRVNPLVLAYTNIMAVGTSAHPIMQDERIYWNGQPIGVVLADTQEQADHAISLIQASYETEPAPTFAQAKKDARVPETINFQPSEIEIGDAETALAAAAAQVDLTFRTPRQSHNPIEPHAVTLRWEGDELFIHDAQQGVKQAAWTIAGCFDLNEDQVHVSSPYIGGGFGCKILGVHHILAAGASRLAGRPVRATLSREGVNRTVGGRANTEQRVAIGADRSGRFTAIVHTGVSAITSHNILAEPFTFPTRHLYGSESFKIRQEVAEMNIVANGFMRAPGEAVGSFALECAIDELACELEMDPIELRLRNEPASDPTSGQAFSSRHLVKAYEAGARRFRWAARRARPWSVREGEWRIGTGCATATYPYVRWPGAGARLSVNKVGHATIEVPASDMGMGTSTVQTMVAAQRLGLPMEKVTVTYGESSSPGAVMAAASSQTASIGAAVISAQRLLVAELMQMVTDDSPLAGLGPDEVGCRDGGLCKLDEPECYESYATLLNRAGRDDLTVVGTASDPDEMGEWSMHSYGALFCQVRVSAITGEIRVDEFLGSFDCGRILNSTSAASQFRGGIVMGLGLALMEETEIDDRTGRIMNPGLSGYHVPVHADVPEIDVMWLDIPDPRAPMGARGIGEVGITGVGAAVANAVFNATGTRVRDLPITPDKTLSDG